MKLDEIALLAGVSKTTASYVINGKAEKYRISQKTQQRVLAVVQQHDYQPNHAASALRGGASKTFGLVVPDIENSSYAKLAKLLERDARKQGYHLIICSSDDDAENEQAVVSSLISRRIDVLIVASCLSASDEYYLEVQNKGIPVVAVDRLFNAEHFASVISDDLEGAFQLTQSLIDLGCKRIALVAAAQDLVVSKEREQGFHQAIAAAAEPIETEVEYGERFSREESAAIVRNWVKQQCLPEAIVATSYTLFEGIMDVLVEQPELASRVKLATFGDHALLNMLTIKVQSLPQQLELVADATLKLAFAAANGKAPKGARSIPRKLLTR
ncbi:catabolite repressor/activator [Agarivorans gilvus]|jgi:LacI family fructose operon transcriptional repressor|uniref:DNA-binding transcriptional regulator FruR n=1 Tax=Agarivorans gilvus TaxID=680279 RepID=A0ABQ1HXC2_9ALTE|nr:catabolite repressor/activator [Agarivorans gilvus]GGA94580.1 DNA-binding transcriptional regulator FruR [Agarivorans gilvus]